MRLPALPSLASVAVLVILIIVLATGEGEEEPAGKGAAPSAEARVTRVVDGDTVEATVDGRTEDVRYIGIDTPESVKPDAPVECFGPEASDLNEDLVEGETVRLEYGPERRDVYGRLLAYVRLGDTFINAELVRRGYATTLEIPPNTQHAQLFARLEREAAASGRGLWGACAGR